MGKGTKVVAHEGMDTDTGIFYKCGYGDEHCSTLPIGYPLPSPTGLGIPAPAVDNFFNKKEVFFNPEHNVVMHYPTKR